MVRSKQRGRRREGKAEREAGREGVKRERRKKRRRGNVITQKSCCLQERVGRPFIHEDERKEIMFQVMFTLESPGTFLKN